MLLILEMTESAKGNQLVRTIQLSMKENFENPSRRCGDSDL